jgi:hypothetical protein
MILVVLGRLRGLVNWSGIRRNEFGGISKGMMKWGNALRRRLRSCDM